MEQRVRISSEYLGFPPSREKDQSKVRGKGKGEGRKEEEGRHTQTHPLSGKNVTCFEQCVLVR